MTRIYILPYTCISIHTNKTRKVMKTFIFKVIYEINPAFYVMSDDDSGLRSSKRKVTAETEEEAIEEIEDSCIDPIHSIELLSVK